MDWLFKEENYTPENDNDRYIEKSISSILKVVSTIKKSYNIDENGFLYRVNAAIKLLGTLMTIILISSARSIIFALIINFVLVMLYIWQMKKESLKSIMLPITITAFTLIMLIPSMLQGNLKNSITLALKVFGAVGYAGLLSKTTSWSDISRALKMFFIPDIFIFTMETTLKYINLLGDIAVEMLYALKVRSIGKNNKRYVGLSAIGGNLFLKSKEMSEEMYSAMECRGFMGEYAMPVKFKLSKHDLVYIFMNAIIIAIFIWREVVR